LNWKRHYRVRKHHLFRVSWFHNSLTWTYDDGTLHLESYFRTFYLCLVLIKFYKTLICWDRIAAHPQAENAKAVYKPVWHIQLLSVQWINCWWWTEELSETCRVSCQNKFMKLVHLVGYIINKFVTMHGQHERKKKSVSSPSPRCYILRHMWSRNMWHVPKECDIMYWAT